MKTVAIIQARFGSTRLPGKVLRKILGKPMLQHVVERCQRSKTVDEVVIATSVDSNCDGIAELCEKQAWSYFRGSEENVLDRYFKSATIYEADIVVRATSDNPLIDPEIIDLHVERMISKWHQVDVVTSNIEKTYPIGLAVEVLAIDVLARLKRLGVSARSREHVTTLIYDSPELFLIDEILNEEDLSKIRLTVDTSEDFELNSRIFGSFGHNEFSWHDVIRLLRSDESLSELNRHVIQKSV